MPVTPVSAHLFGGFIRYMLQKKMATIEIPTTFNNFPTEPSYLSCLSKTATGIKLKDGQTASVWVLSTPTNVSELSNWARLFRQQYCPDTELDELRDGTGLSRAEFLTEIIFPGKTVAPGPAVRSGDFAELLVSDYLEHLLGYWVPRAKYAEKATRDESVKGVDILGFKMATSIGESLEDCLMAFEVKAQCTGGKYAGRLQTAIDNSSKDFLRRAYTLNATKRRLLWTGQKDQALIVKRFQDIADHPYIYKSGAAALLSDDAYNEAEISSHTSVENHSNKENLELVVIKGIELMSLVHSIYERAADEA